jgi:hypothetical protein
MLQRSERSSSAMLHDLHMRPFVLGKWQHLVTPDGGIRREMHDSAAQHSKPVGTGLSSAAMHKLYNREVRSTDLYYWWCLGLQWLDSRLLLAILRKARVLPQRAKRVHDSHAHPSSDPLTWDHVRSAHWHFQGDTTAIRPGSNPGARLCAAERKAQARM